MSENLVRNNSNNSNFQMCANQSEVGSDCTLETKNIISIPSGVIIRPLTKSWECSLNCTNRRKCSHFEERD